jgi:prepilin peptidase CpaA
MDMLESTYASQVSIACFVALVLVGAVSDIVSYKIPNVVVLMILVLYPFYVLVSPQEVEWLYSIGIFAAVIVIGMLLYNFKIFGAGDAKLLAAIMLWAGPNLALLVLLIGVFASGALSLVMLTSARFVIASALSAISRRDLGDKFLAHSMPWGTGLGVSGLFTGWGLFVGLQLPSIL